MKCPFCAADSSKVIDSRPTEDGFAIRRRRECNSCTNRFTTYEKVEEVPLVVVKKDGTREAFNRNKILNGIIRACEKRPVSVELMENIVGDIEKKLNNSLVKEIETSVIGEHIMDALKDIDEVSYVRFASVYRQFKDTQSFLEEIAKIMKDKKA
ncbi:MAG: transcriptional regulator NrdR [Clostridiales bacterium]|nr:MAG: transcriptional regulator NrdR [Clostridiales bacterium]